MLVLVLALMLVLVLVLVPTPPFAPGPKPGLAPMRMPMSILTLEHPTQNVGLCVFE